MTLPDEERRALKAAWRFLLDLIDPQGPWKSIGDIRRRARDVMRHYPGYGRIDEMMDAVERRKEEGD